MKTYLLPLPLLAFTAASLSLAAQTTSHTPVHRTATGESRAGHSAEGGCVRLPELSPNIPALPPGTPCAKALFTFTTVPPVHLDYISPLVTPEVRESLGMMPQTFSLDYSEIKVGEGELALPHKWYTVNYTLYLLDGTRVESSLDKGEPFSFPVGQHRVIAGWDLGTQGMHIGGKRRLYIPYQLAYGDRGQQRIPPKSELVFDIELLSQSDTQPAPPKPEPSPSTPQAGQPATPPSAAKPNTPINTTTPNAKAPTPK